MDCATARNLQTHSSPGQQKLRPLMLRPTGSDLFATSSFGNDRKSTATDQQPTQQRTDFDVACAERDSIEEHRACSRKNNFYPFREETHVVGTDTL